MRLRHFLEASREVREVWALVCIVLAQVITSGVYGVDLLIMREKLQMVDTVGSLEDAAFLVVMGLMILFAETGFAVLCVRRESSCDLVVLQSLALLSSCSPLFTELYLSTQDVRNGLGLAMDPGAAASAPTWLAQPARIALLCVIGSCALALMAIALRVWREFSWRQGHHNANQQTFLAMVFGAGYHLDAALTLLVACVPMSSQLREHLTHSAPVAVAITAVVALSSAAFLGGVFCLSARPRLLRRPHVQPLLMSLGIAPAVVLSAWMVWSILQRARIGAPRHANGSTDVLGSMAQVTATVLMGVALLVRVALLLLLRQTFRDPERDKVWSWMEHYLRARPRKTVLSQQTLMRMTSLVSDALDDGSFSARNQVKRASLGLEVVTRGDFLNVRQPWRPSEMSFRRLCCRSAKSPQDADSSRQAGGAEPTSNTGRTVAAAAAAFHIAADHNAAASHSSAAAKTASGHAAAAEQGGDGEPPRVRKMKRFVQRTPAGATPTPPSRSASLLCPFAAQLT